MKVVLVHYDDYPWDVRIEKFLRVLENLCDEVHLITRNRKRLPIHQRIGSIIVHRLRPLPSIDNWTTLLDSPAFLNPRWFHRIGEVVTQVEPSIVIVRDLPLALACRYWARRVGAPLIFDMAEDYPAMFSAYHPWETIRERLVNLILRNERLARTVERISIRTADHLLVVTEEQRDRLVRSGVSEDKITIVRNTPVTFSCTANHNGSRAPKVIYVGEVHHMRGLDCAIRAIGRLVRNARNIYFRILGTGKTEAALRKLAAREAPQNISFQGWVDHSQLPAELASSDIGLIPHQCNKFTSTTVPNKLFDYMAAGLPVVASATTPLARLIEETKCGLVFPSGDDGALAEALESLYDPNRRRRLGTNGREAVERRYNWTVDGGVLRNTVIDCIERSKKC